MSKKDTAAAITALNGSTLDESQYTQKELDAMLNAAEKGVDGQAQFDNLQASYDADGAPVGEEAELTSGTEVIYTDDKGKEHPGRIIRVNDSETGDVAISVEALGAESQQMSVSQDRWKIKKDA